MAHSGTSTSDPILPDAAEHSSLAKKVSLDAVLQHLEALSARQERLPTIAMPTAMVRWKLGNVMGNLRNSDPPLFFRQLLDTEGRSTGYAARLSTPGNPWAIYSFGPNGPAGKMWVVGEPDVHFKPEEFLNYFGCSLESVPEVDLEVAQKKTQTTKARSKPNAREATKKAAAKLVALGNKLRNDESPNKLKFQRLDSFLKECVEDGVPIRLYSKKFNAKDESKDAIVQGCSEKGQFIVTYGDPSATARLAMCKYLYYVSGKVRKYVKGGSEDICIRGSDSYTFSRMKLVSNTCPVVTLAKRHKKAKQAESSSEDEEEEEPEANQDQEAEEEQDQAGDGAKETADTTTGNEDEGDEHDEEDQEPAPAKPKDKKRKRSEPKASTTKKTTHVKKGESSKVIEAKAKPTPKKAKVDKKARKALSREEHQELSD